MARPSLSFRAAALVKRFKGDKVTALLELDYTDEYARHLAARLTWHDIVHHYWLASKSIY